MTIAADILLARRLADAAGQAALAWFRHAPEIETKDDLSPVTAADKAAESAMRHILEADRPRDGIYGEEYGLSGGSSGRVWVLDPIDGTRAFIAGRPTWGTLIALVEEGRPVLGIINAPAAGDQWLGCTVGTSFATLNGQPIHVRPCPDLASARAASTHPLLFSAAGHGAFLRVGRRVSDVLFGGDCYNYGLVAAGHLDLVMEEGLKPYDWSALVPVIEGAGGIMTDWAGEPLTMRSNGQVLATGDRQLHALAMELI